MNIMRDSKSLRDTHAGRSKIAFLELATPFLELATFGTFGVSGTLFKYYESLDELKKHTFHKNMEALLQDLKNEDTEKAFRKIELENKDDEDEFSIKLMNMLCDEANKFKASLFSNLIKNSASEKMPGNVFIDLANGIFDSSSRSLKSFCTLAEEISVAPGEKDVLILKYFGDLLDSLEMTCRNNYDDQVKEFRGRTLSVYGTLQLRYSFNLEPFLIKRIGSAYANNDEKDAIKEFDDSCRRYLLVQSKLNGRCVEGSNIGRYERDKFRGYHFMNLTVEEYKDMKKRNEQEEQTISY